MLIKLLRRDPIKTPTSGQPFVELVRSEEGDDPSTSATREDRLTLLIDFAVRVDSNVSTELGETLFTVIYDGRRFLDTVLLANKRSICMIVKKWMEEEEKQIKEIIITTENHDVRCRISFTSTHQQRGK
jgi:hypothetical protein